MMETINGAMTVVLLILFIAIWVWAWNGRNKKAFDKMSHLPLEENSVDSVEKKEAVNVNR